MVEKGKFDHIEERMRAIEGGGDYAFADMTELCLVLDVVIPPKFEVLDFDKYRGTTCPKNHLKMYSRKMGACAKDEKLWMHFFQECLTGAMLDFPCSYFLVHFFFIQICSREIRFAGKRTGSSSI